MNRNFCVQIANVVTSSFIPAFAILFLLATKWLQSLSLGGIDKLRNRFVANLIFSSPITKSKITLKRPSVLKEEFCKNFTRQNFLVKTILYIRLFTHTNQLPEIWYSNNLREQTFLLQRAFLISRARVRFVAKFELKKKKNCTPVDCRILAKEKQTKGSGTRRTRSASCPPRKLQCHVLQKCHAESSPLD